MLKRASLEAAEHTETLQEEGARLRAELASSAEESEQASQQAQRSAESAAAELARWREELAHSSEAEQRAVDAQTVLEQEKGELQELAGKQAALHGFTAGNPNPGPHHTWCTACFCSAAVAVSAPGFQALGGRPQIARTATVMRSSVQEHAARHSRGS